VTSHALAASNTIAADPDDGRATMADKMGGETVLWDDSWKPGLLLSPSTTKSQQVLGVFGGCRSIANAL
jgi:hypothetical protein